MSPGIARPGGRTEARADAIRRERAELKHKLQTDLRLLRQVRLGNISNEEFEALSRNTSPVANRPPAYGDNVESPVGGMIGPSAQNSRLPSREQEELQMAIALSLSTLLSSRQAPSGKQHTAISASSVSSLFQQDGRASFDAAQFESDLGVFALPSPAL